ncbi:restriction endonuclease subunit S [Pseudoalteromonas sp. Angola-4]|uniref:restriction endonuclease subunit S n=1 Tax=Pseudoalteromonas sp. Angola-4 TaxID=3025335 RepID=UPI002359949A|nr:restriction endonuclease subunit S [Pseudoalteromonas sp. Angola-4]MDC9511452.1 restriction endonuclease subunit S [Pseudoalteromonas sp. Angola-4]
MLNIVDKPSLHFNSSVNYTHAYLGALADISTGGKDTKDAVDSGKYPFYVRSDSVKSINSFSKNTEAILTSGDGVGVGKNYHYVNGRFDYHQRVYCLDNFKGVFGKYLYFLFCKNFYKRVIRLSAKNSVDSVRRDMLTEMDVFIPDSIDEQQKIANFLTSVDNKISQLTEKQRLIKDYKKGVMQQIFSQQIRFKDDDGNAFPDWEVKTIGDVMTESRIKGSSGDIAKKLTVKIRGKGVTPKKDDSKGSENTQYYKRQAGQFIYGKLDFLNCAFAIIPDELDGYESTLDLPSLDVSSAVNKFFVLEVVKQKRFYKRFGEVADGSRKAKRINVGVFQEMPINLPSKAEQDKIMTFLQSLDKKINAVNEQIEQTKLFKKGLLQQMFV